MEKQKLPNETLILVLGIISIITCCCWGIGLVLGIVTLVLAGKATQIYIQNPELYPGYQNVKTGKILAIIGIVLSAIYLIIAIYINVVIGSEEFQIMVKEWAEEMQNQ